MDLRDNQVEMKLNIRDLLWDLLTQWKAVLLASLIMMLLIAGLKYYTDTNAYKAALQSAKEAEEMKSVPVEEQISKILDAFPADERTKIEYAIQQKEWLDEKTDYVNKSILLNTNPTSQRTLILDYCITAGNKSDAIAVALARGYAFYMNDEKVLDQVRQVIGSDLDNKYIAELISTPFSNPYDKNGEIIDADAGAVVLETRVVMPEGVDAEQMEKAVTAALKDYSRELSGTVGDHTIKLLKSSEANLYNRDAVNSRDTILSTIYSMQNTYIKSTEILLTDQQLAASEAVVALKRSVANGTQQIQESAETAGADAVQKPRIGKKYLMLGFILGAMAYVFVYMLYVMLKGNVSSAEQLEYYSGSRLLGEVYYRNKNAKNKLMQSKLVDGIRFKDKLDENRQVDKLISSIMAVCQHANASDFTLFRLVDADDDNNGLIDKIINKAKDCGIDTAVEDITGEVDEQKLVSAKNAICIAGNRSKAKSVMDLRSLLNEYDIKQLGNVFLG